MYEADRDITPVTFDKHQIEYRPAEKAEKIPLILVDDNVAILEMLSEGLTRYGFEVTKAEDGFKALKSLERESFKLVITDFQMPGMNGLELASTIKRQYPSMIVVLMTGTDRSYLEEKQELKDIDLFVPKPFRISTFVDMVGAILKQ